MNTVVADIFTKARVKHKVTNEQILSSRGKRALTNARKDIITELRDSYNYSFTMMGTILNRQYTTIMYIYKK